MADLSVHDKAVLNCIFNPHLPLDEASIVEEQKLEDEETETDEVKRTREMEVKAIDLAEKGEFLDAVNLLNKAIKIAPNRASLYNNRAHVYQFQRKFEEALTDLTTAIELVDEKQRKTKCHSHCQRGVLHRRAERIDEARADFEIAAKLGSQFAKSQLVELNPYAALCNQMLRQVADNL